MKLKYQTYQLHLEFEKEFYFSIYPTFLFRSILGKELRRLSCLFEKRECKDCELNKSCNYSKLFETPVDKENIFLKGGENSSHPMIIYSDVKDREKRKKMILDITLLEKGIDLFPYVFLSLTEAGKLGIGKNRVKYIILDRKLVNFSKEFTFEYFPEEKIELKNKKYLINLKTPLRFKMKGEFLKDFNYFQLIDIIFRRLKVLIAFYGEYNSEMELKLLKERDNFFSLKATEKSMEKNLFWSEQYRYSAHQKRKMKLGGVVGTILLEGEFTTFEISLLNFASIFNIGKNISFGLGNISIKEL